LACVGRAADRPNIVVILTDDMGYSDLGCYGGEISTPNIDRLAAGGIRFTQFYNTARCCPTRAALLTGLYPHQAGLGHMTWEKFPRLPGYQADLSRDAPTVAEVLKSGGYATYMTGKWHVTIDDQPAKPKDNWPRQRGFDRFYGVIKGSGSYYDPAMLVRENQPIAPSADGEYQPKSYYLTDAITDQSVRFIREHVESEQRGGAPFFLYVAYTAPHWPLHAPEEAVARYKGKYDAGYEPIRAARFERMKQMGLIDPRWELSPTPEAWEKQADKAWEARCMEVYAAQVTAMDAGVGKIVAALEQAKQLDNTLILYLHDNGGCDESNGRTPRPRGPGPDAKDPKPDMPQTVSRPARTRDGRPVRSGVGVMPGGDDTFIAYGRNWANVSNTPFREYKHYVHEGGISTPLVAHWPKGIAPSRGGQFERQPGHVIDLPATCLEAAGVSLPSRFNGKAPMPLQGISLAPLFREGGSVARPAPIFFEHEGNRAVRDGKWKLVAKGEHGPWELYDLEADRTEVRDLASKEPDRVKSMGAAWQKWAEATNVLPMLPQEKSLKAPTIRTAESVGEP
jgi:arylsulfatase